MLFSLFSQCPPWFRNCWIIQSRSQDPQVALLWFHTEGSWKNAQSKVFLCFNSFICLSITASRPWKFQTLHWEWSVTSYFIKHRGLTCTQPSSLFQKGYIFLVKRWLDYYTVPCRNKPEFVCLFISKTGFRILQGGERLCSQEIRAHVRASCPHHPSPFVAKQDQTEWWMVRVVYKTIEYV